MTLTESIGTGREEELIRTIWKADDYVEKAIEIVSIKFDTCIGDVPNEYHGKLKKSNTYGEYRTMELLLEFNSSYAHHFDAFIKLFEKIKRLTDWEFDSFLVDKRGITFRFNNYQELIDTHI